MTQAIAISQMNLAGLFEYHVKSNPRQIAVSSERLTLNYHDLNERSNQLAHYIQQCYQQSYPEQKFPSETLIAFCLPQGIDAIIAMLAIIKCGAAYVPLDINNPVERLSYILANSQSILLVTNEDVIKTTPELANLSENMISLDDKRQARLLAEQSTDNLEINMPLQQLAYVMYTSGSTGKPKGVMIEQQSIIHLVRNTNYIDIQPQDKIAAIANLSFDAATFEIWGALLNGATIICGSKDIHQNVDNFKIFLDSNFVTIAFLTTPLFHLMAANDASLFKNFHYLLVGGDVINPQLMQAVCDCPFGKPKHLLHVYGPTENTTFSTAYEVKCVEDNAITVPIGNFIAGCYGYILDDNNQPCAIGATGELYLGGNGLARGYLKQSATENDKFTTTINSSERLYRTGDLVRLVNYQTIEFVGRVDNQIKIRGFRVELGEIEAILNQQPDIEQAAVVVCGEGSERKFLTAYCVMQDAKDSVSPEKIVNYWENVYEHLYQLQDLGEPLDDFSGWESSFTRKHIPLAEMKEWQSATVNRILSLQPQHILEIGCGSGLLLFQLVKHCQYYYGIDISDKVIDRLNTVLQYSNVSNANVAKDYADKLSSVPQRDFDCIIINSVVIHFPCEAYLTSVLALAISKIKQGTVFIGDVRDYRLLNTFSLAVIRHQHPDLSWQECQQLAEYRTLNEQELLVSPEYFIELARKISAISNIEILPKRGNSLCEMNCYRYDVVLHINQAKPAPTIIDWQNWHEDIDIGSLLRNRKNSIIAIAHYPNLRVWLDFQITQLLVNNKDPQPHLRAYQNIAKRLIGLEYLYSIAAKYDYQLYPYIDIGGHNAAACYNLVFVSKESDFTPGNYGYSHIDDNNHVNIPIPRFQYCSFDTIRAAIDQLLPTYMHPAQYVQLDKMPLTPNGKIDRKRLRQIKQAKSERSALRCIDNIHYQVVLLWESVFKLTPISPDANFFGLGGNSILAIQLIYLINKKFSLQLSVAWIFKYQDINSQADNIRAEHELHGKYQPIITFNQNGDTLPFYMIHPGLIGAECYAELANLLDRRINFFGVDSYNLYNDPMLMTVTDLTKYYAAQILGKLETKSIYLGGWSLGGLLAYQIAIELSQQGVNIERLFLIDPDPPKHHYEVVDNSSSVDVKKLNDTPEYILSYLKKLPQELIDRVLNNLTHDLKLSSHFVPQQSHSGKTIIFEAEHWSGGAFMGDQVSANKVWSPYILNMKNYTLPGDHFSLMDDQNIEAIANIMNTEILSGNGYYEY